MRPFFFLLRWRLACQPWPMRRHVMDCHGVAELATRTRHEPLMGSSEASKKIKERKYWNHTKIPKQRLHDLCKCALKNLCLRCLKIAKCQPCLVLGRRVLAKPSPGNSTVGPASIFSQPVGALWVSIGYTFHKSLNPDFGLLYWCYFAWDAHYQKDLETLVLDEDWILWQGLLNY